MEPDSPGIRRACIAIATARTDPFANGKAAERCSDESQRRRLSVLFGRVCTAAGVSRALFDFQPSFNEHLAVLPTGIDEPRVIALLVTELAIALRRIAIDSRPRLVMAVHEGLIELDGEGFGGPAIAKTCRLANSAELHATLAGDPTANLLVLLSERIFDDLTERDRSAFSASRFQRVEIGDSRGGQPDVGWVFLPG